MLRLSYMLLIAIGCCSIQTGCSHFSHDCQNPNAVTCAQAESKESECDAKTLFEWNIGPKDDKDKKEDKEEKDEKSDSKEKTNGDGKKNGKDKEEKESSTKEKNGADDKKDDKKEEERLQSDRPDFTEASSTVGKGRIQVESGYTYFTDREGGSKSHSHSYPEMLIRAGLFADWFELRIGQNFAADKSTTGGVTTRQDGAQDLYLGVKLALTEQKKYLPETALILQSTIPTGADEYTSRQMMPGFNFCYSWEIVEDCLGLSGSFGLNRSRDDTGHFFGIMHNSWSLGYTLTKDLTAYTEVFGTFPNSAIAPDTTAQYYFNYGLQYFFSNNFAMDVRMGMGLNKHADDYFYGLGFVYRY